MNKDASSGLAKYLAEVKSDAAKHVGSDPSNEAEVNYGRNFESYARNFESYARNFESYARNFENYARNFENGYTLIPTGTDRSGTLPNGEKVPNSAKELRALIQKRLI